MADAGAVGQFEWDYFISPRRVAEAMQRLSVSLTVLHKGAPEFGSEGRGGR